jgi:hypothetical protein
MLNRLAAFALCLLLTACAVTPLQPPSDPKAVRCLDLYTAVDQAVTEHGTRPSSPARIDSFPYLRVNRFLASYREQSLNPAERAAWLARLAELDREARQVELASLPPPVLTELTARYTAPETLQTTLQTCSQTLQANDLADSERFASLRERAVVPSDYHTLRQVAGLYPLTALPVSYGIFRWHEETYDTFAQPLATLPVQGKLRRFRPPDGQVQAPPVAQLPRDALGIPSLDPQPLAALFAAHAPVWEIDVAGAFDLPGAPFWQADGTPGVDTSKPVVYRYPSYTRWQNQVLLQLNYVIWFAERPPSRPLDILAGPLDGLIWRVTLDANGRPLLYDSIHPCGCYHQFFPSTALRLRSNALDLPEPPLVPQPAPLLSSGQRIVIRLSSGSHYIQRVYADIPAGSVYTWEDYQALYAVPDGDRRRSLFDSDGLVPGTERAERWLLWPMGIPAPGAMRERGRHATAFVGRRYFDDPDLLAQLFAPVQARISNIDNLKATRR